MKFQAHRRPPSYLVTETAELRGGSKVPPQIHFKLKRENFHVTSNSQVPLIPAIHQLVQSGQSQQFV